MCSVDEGNVFSLQANVFSFWPEVFTFRPNVFTFDRQVFSIRRCASSRTPPSAGSGPVSGDAGMTGMCPPCRADVSSFLARCVNFSAECVQFRGHCVHFGGPCVHFREARPSRSLLCGRPRARSPTGGGKTVSRGRWVSGAWLVVGRVDGATGDRRSQAARSLGHVQVRGCAEEAGQRRVPNARLGWGRGVVRHSLSETSGRLATNGVGGGEEGTHKGRPYVVAGWARRAEGTHKGRPYMERVLRCGWSRHVRTTGSTSLRGGRTVATQSEPLTASGSG